MITENPFKKRAKGNNVTVNAISNVKQCRSCNATYICKRSTSIYCSSGCRAAAWKKRNVKNNSLMEYEKRPHEAYGTAPVPKMYLDFFSDFYSVLMQIHGYPIDHDFIEEEMKYMMALDDGTKDMEGVWEELMRQLY